MTRIGDTSTSRGLITVLGAALAGAFLLAAPAQAQRPSLDTLANDHIDLADDHDTILGGQHHGVVAISTCGTIDAPGSYIVTQKLDAVGDCLVVTADHVTIDLNGMVISGDGTGAGVTSDSDDGSPRRNIALRNGTVTGFLNGVSFLFHEAVIIEGVRAVDNLDNGIDLAESLFGTVAGNVALDNGRNGISGLSFGAIIGNTVANSGVDGIGGGGDNRVAGNTVTESGRHGIDTLAGTVADNTVTGSAVDGIRARAFSMATGNTSRQNGRDGFFVQRGLATGNTAVANLRDGIRAACPSNVIGNMAFNNTGANLNLLGAGCNDVNNVAP